MVPHIRLPPPKRSNSCPLNFLPSITEEEVCSALVLPHQYLTPHGALRYGTRPSLGRGKVRGLQRSSSLSPDSPKSPVQSPTACQLGLAQWVDPNALPMDLEATKRRHYARRRAQCEAVLGAEQCSEAEWKMTLRRERGRRLQGLLREVERTSPKGRSAIP